MMNSTWVLLADGSRAQLYEKGGNDHRDWKLLKAFDHPPARQSGQDLAGNRPDAIQHQMESTAKGTEGAHGVQEYESSRFASELSDYLHGAATRNEFSRLVVAAAPRFLGTLKAKFSKPVKERISHFLAKDYASRAPHEVAPHMAGL
jgi:protein required for attachment to host cells